LIPPDAAGLKIDLRDRIKHLTTEDAERARLIRHCRSFGEKRMGHGMYPNTCKLRDYLIFSGHKPGLVSRVVNFRENPLTKNGLEEVITIVGFLGISELQTLLAKTAIDEQKFGNNSAISSSTKQHQQPSSSRHRKERQPWQAVISSTKEKTASASSARPRSRAVSREETWDRKTHVYNKTGSAHHNWTNGQLEIKCCTSIFIWQAS
jgi:hypothetical protein